MTAKEYLEQLIVMDNVINHKQQRLETLRGVAVNTSAVIGSEAVQHIRRLKI